MRKCAHLFAMVALWVATQISAFGLVLLDDPFTDGSRSNTTGGDVLGGVWWQSVTAAGAVTIVDDSAGIGTGSAMQMVPTVDFHKLLTFFSATTLAAEGDTIRVSFDYRFPAGVTPAGDGFRIGLCNSATTRQTSDTGGSTRNDDKNYGFNTNPGLTGTSTGVKYEDAGDDILGGSGAGSRIGFGTSGGSVASGTVKHSALLQITRFANGDLGVQAQVDALPRASGTHAAASVLTYTFDEFAFGFGGTGYRPTILVDNVLVESVRLSVLNIAATAPNAAEIGLVPAMFTVTRSSTTGPLSVPYTVTGTATAGADYVPLSGMVEFADGQASATITVTPLEDWFIEGSETVIITLAQPVGAVLQTASATASIADDPARTIPSDALFFSKLDLTRPGLGAVQTAVAAQDYAAATSALASYFRTRTTPLYPLASITPSTTVINDALNHKYTVVGIAYDFEPEPVTTINWSFNPTVPLNNEWVWQFNRHGWWIDLAQAWVNNTANNAYLDELLFELDDWITNSPVPVSGFNTSGTSRWRTIEAGIRMQGGWLESLFRVRTSPRLSDALLVKWLKSIYMHARHLQDYTAGTGNWVAIEQRGLFSVGAVFQEFTEAPAWRALAISRLETLLANDVYADGAEVELAPSYHDLVINDVERVKQLAIANGLPTSAAFDGPLEKLYAYELWSSEPLRRIPRINDSTSDVNVVSRLASGFATFPARTDFQWIATNGASGTIPDHTSHLFPDAGQIVMRSNWTTAGNYLLMDAGPFGTAHQHEDKLSLSVDGYGVRHIIDAGPYDYDTSIYRTHSLRSHANSQPLIDDLDQNRSVDPTLRRPQTPITWRTSSLYDYAAASYGDDAREGWGPSRLRPAITRRHVFFMKPDAWVVIDAFTALDADPHTYSALFNCSDDTVAIDAPAQRVTVQLLPGEFDPYALTTVSAAKSSLTITPLVAGGQTLQVIKGQDTPNPLLGWQYYISSATKKRPIPTARYDRTVAGDTQMAYVLAAAPAGSAPRTPIITQAATAIGTYGVTVSFGNPNDAQTFLIGLDGANTMWNGTAYAAPALVASASGAYAWDATKPIDAWKFGYFGTANPLAADLADGDADGLCTLLEYALATDPTVRNANPVQTGRDNSGALTLTYRRERPASEIKYRVEVSGDLVNWSFGPAVVSEALQPDGVTCIATDLAGGGKRFIRLRALRSQ